MHEAAIIAAREVVRACAAAACGRARDASFQVPQQSSSALHTIFSEVHDTVKPSWFMPGVLRVDDDRLFPRADPSTPTRSTVALQTALDAATMAPAQEIALLLAALEREAWALPSPIPGVSLYDYARTTAAEQAVGAVGGNALLVGGDLSGVQEFLFTVPAKRAAKQLRGRSLYLQLLCEAIARFLVTQAGMPDVCLLYSGGGRFYALLPASAEATLLHWQRWINQVLLTYHGVIPYLALGWRTLGTDYAADWKELQEVLSDAKQRKFATLDADEVARKLFHPREMDQTPSESQDLQPVLPFDASMEELGSKLRDARFIAERAIPQPNRPLPPERTSVTWQMILQHFGRDVIVLEHPRLLTWKDGMVRTVRDLPDAQEELRLSDMFSRQGLVFGRRYIVSELRLLTTAEAVAASSSTDEHAPRAGDPMSFDMLASKSTGIKRLGVLRMDVDDLGRLFSGTRTSQTRILDDLARTTALSTALGRFFEGYVGTLCRRLNEQHQQTGGGGIYTIYSGGDDLFIVGSWDVLPDLANDIRTAFGRYVTGTRETPSPITLSAGLTLHHGTFPIYQAADEAAAALDEAKRWRRTESAHTKDALSFLGRTIGWEDYAMVSAHKAHFAALVTTDVPRSLLMLLQTLAAQSTAKSFTRQGLPQVAHGPWLWRGAYMLTRLAERSKAKRKEIEAIRDTILRVTSDPNPPVVLAGLAARWAQLYIRGE